MGETIQRKRIDWIDCAKGIGIILVIIGHTSTVDDQISHIITRGTIFSFHMPLFFVLSCMTYRMSTSGETFIKNTEKAFKHLIVPMLLVYMLIFVIGILREHDDLQIRDYIANRINALIYASGAPVNVFDAMIPMLGLLWFVVVLFISRQLFDYLHLKLNDPWFICLIMILAICGVAVSIIQWLPLSFDIVLAVFPFLWMGMKLKTIDLDKRMFVWGVASILIWAVTLLLTYKTAHTYLELAIRNYPLFPLCYLTAAAGTMSVIFAGKLTTRYIGSHGLGLTWIGRNSMTLYLIHALDYIYIELWKIVDNDAVSALIRVSIDILLCIIFVNIKRKIKDGRRENGEIRE